MPFIKQLDLLKAVKDPKWHPDGVIEGNRRKIVTLIELGGKDFRTPEMVMRLKEYWKPSKDDILYVINLDGIDVMTPSATKILVESASDIASECKIPIIFTNVREMARESLESESCRCNPPKILWIMNERGEAHLVGQVPNKVQELLNLLEEKGAASASQIAAQEEGENSKKSIGNLSVYLQKLFNAGLVGREKVTALDRDDAERGWTYIYKTAPTIQRHSSPKSYITKP